MTTAIFAKQALTSNGWQHNVTVEINDSGQISDISTGEKEADRKVGILLPALSNLHSHSFQRAMAGLAETRGPNPHDDFWTWRKVMYRFLEILSPEDIEVIAAQVQMEMLESGYGSCAEFHYLHHAQNGQRYDDIMELSQRHFESALLTGIGYTHLPVLYMQGGLDGRPLNGGQLRFGCEIDEFEKLLSKLSLPIQSLPRDFSLGVAPHSLRAVSISGLQSCVDLRPNGPIHIHAAEQTAEVTEVSEALGARPVEWLLNNMPVDQRWCLIHATHLNQNETNSLARSGAVAGLCPITEANLGDGIFNAAEFLNQGGQFGIGADSNVKIALSEELRMLEVSQRLRDQQRVILSDEAQPSNGRYLYERAASGGAQALGRKAGEIGIGYYADLVALDDTHYAISGLSEDTILDTWVFACSDDIVGDVWSAGRHVVNNGEHVKRDEITRNFHATITRLRNLL